MVTKEQVERAKFAADAAWDKYSKLKREYYNENGSN